MGAPAGLALVALACLLASLPPIATGSPARDVLSSLPLRGTLTFFNTTACKSVNEDDLAPAGVVYPSDVDDVAAVVRAVAAADAGLTVAARGLGHNIRGRSQAHNAVILEMTTMKGINVVSTGDAASGGVPFVEAMGGALWVDVLKASLEVGMAPRSWTDYLYLTVGGTLSNAGVSGQTFRHGPEVSNVLELQVVTGKGDIVDCSRTKHSELFFAVLGGLGQFGIITKARIVLEKAPQRVRWMRALYTDFATFKADQELLISATSPFDFVEGFVVVNNENPINGWSSVPFIQSEINAAVIPSQAGEVMYCLEVTKAYSVADLHTVDQVVESMLAPLHFHRELLFKTDATYFQFLDRVHDTEMKLQKTSEWEIPHACEWKMPHPTLNVFVPASAMEQFDRLVFKRLVTSEVNGPVLVYPMNKSKWDARLSVAVPEGSEETFYMVAILSNKVPANPALRSKMMQDNESILKVTEQLGGKQYLPKHQHIRQWRRHFGSKWAAFVEHKQMFDSRAILAPGQNLFKAGENHFNQRIRMSRN